MFRLASSLGFTEPQLPSLVEKPSEGKHWIHEIKHDGYRSMVCLSEAMRGCSPAMDTIGRPIVRSRHLVPTRQRKAI